MTHRTHSLTLTLCLGALLGLGCDDAEEAPAEPPTAETAPAAAEATPEPAGPPAGWEELEVQVQGNPVTVLAPTEEQEIDAADWGTAVYGTLPGQSYPYYYSL